jgi:hypothetical protein
MNIISYDKSFSSFITFKVIKTLWHYTSSWWYTVKLLHQQVSSMVNLENK